MCDSVDVSQVGIYPEDVNAEVLPSHKKSQIESYQERNNKVYTSHSRTTSQKLIVHYINELISWGADIPGRDGGDV